jgi:glycosyltransferase involved in cell wall biosynthesis
MSPTFVVASNGKFHSLSLASALDKRGQLARLFTVYYSQQNRWVARLVRREDREPIALSRVRTNVWSELPRRIGSRLPILDRYADYMKATWLDAWVARGLAQETADVFIGWSNSSLASLEVARGRGMRTIVTRGSAHISYQKQILALEYAKRGLTLVPPCGIEERELAEYQAADYIRIPSTYVRQTFVDRGVPASKLIQLPYAADLNYFRRQVRESSSTFRVLLLNAATIQKGFYYAAELIAEIQRRAIKPIEFWFIGDVEPFVRPALDDLLARHDNVRSLGRINHYELARYISQCDVAVFPTIQEGFANTVPQTMACGVPVIATVNSGAGDVVTNGTEGFIVPIMDSDALVQKVVWCWEHAAQCREMGRAAAARSQRRSWDDVVAELVRTLTGPIPQPLKVAVG